MEWLSQKCSNKTPGTRSTLIARAAPPPPRGTNYVNPPICISVNTIILFSPKVNYSASEFGIHVRISSFIFDGDEMDVQTKVDKE